MVPAGPTSYEQNKARLIQFYEKHNRDKLNQVDATLRKYAGRENELWRDLDKAYGPDAAFGQVVDGLKRLYTNKIKPLEEKYAFVQFHGPLLTDGDFEAKPMVMLMGQYSVGKTTFIKYLLEREFPGNRIGPEPTTDRFMAIMHSDEDRTIPGNALALQADKPFRSLAMFGTAFLSKFEASCCKSPILERITFIDTPGVLSGEKQRIGRQYDFPRVTEWFAERADRILLLFDAHKLDISDEFKASIDSLRGQDDKVRVVLNKSDAVEPQQLMRVYGALMWSLGKVIQTPEVLRVYIGSFWDQPLNPKGEQNRSLFEAEATDLIEDLRTLPRNSAIRKVNELVKRTRLAKVHALIIGHLKDQMPSMWGHEKKQTELTTNIVDEFRKVQIKYGLPSGDFPNVERFRAVLNGGDIKMSDWPKLKDKYITAVDDALTKDIPSLMAKLPGMAGSQGKGASGDNPFEEDEKVKGWTVTDEAKARYTQFFNQLNPQYGKLTGGQVKDAFLKFGLDVAALRDIWNLSDIDKDGHLDCDEWCVAMHLVEVVKSQGKDVLPSSLPLSMMPASKY
jgi:GTPase SAR1 family protein